MKDIETQIEEMANKIEKSEPTETTTPSIFDVIKSLGPDGLKAKLPTLNDEDKVVLKAALEEMTLKKAITMDANYAAPVINGKVDQTIIQEEIASDDADEKLMKPGNAVQNHQGTPTDGWSGQVIKSMEENIDQVVEKAMSLCKDDKMVMKKLKEKGMDEGKVQGALEKYKAKKEVKKSDEDLEKGKMKEAREEAKEKIMSMEEKEHGTKDPKKLVEAEKKENKMKKSVAWEGEDRLLKANTQGRNFHFNLETFIDETLKHNPEEVKKSDGQKPDDVNDLIQKSEDRSWDQVNLERGAQDNTSKQNGTLVKSFNDEELAASLGMTIEEMKKILG